MTKMSNPNQFLSLINSIINDIDDFACYGIAKQDRFHRSNKRKICDRIIDQIEQIDTANNGIRVFVIATKQ